MIGLALSVLYLLLCWAPVAAEEPFEGRTLISPKNSTVTLLLDMSGATVKTWHGADRPMALAYMLPDESILRPCRDWRSTFAGNGGRIQWIDANDVVIWDYYFLHDDYQQHHDVEPMPNGNVLLIAWERKTLQEALAAGRQIISNEMWPTVIAEIEPVGATGGNIVWEWHLWDHLIQDVDPGLPNYGVVSEHPELLDINFGNVGAPNAIGDWIHANAVDYNEELDQIVFCARVTDEFYVIDHSTTTEEAAGHTGGNSGMGGDILYRWGNPAVYGRELPPPAPGRSFHVIHGVNWIDPGLPGAGNILAFDNGDRDGFENDYSTVVEITPPVDALGHYYLAPDSAFGPSAPTWTFSDSTFFYAGPTHGGAYRLPNGNTLICESEPGYVFEVTMAGTLVWDYDHGSLISRALRYWDDVTAAPSLDDLASAGSPELAVECPNPFRPPSLLSFLSPKDSRARLEIFSVTGRRVMVLADRESGGHFQLTWNGRDMRGIEIPAGIYFLRLEAGDISMTRKMTLLR